MVKEPRVGRVKTRLGRDIGMVDAAWWFRHQMPRLVRRVTDPRWQTVLAVAPKHAMTSRMFPANLPRWDQGGGDLGARMARLLGRARPGPACLIGADIPDASRDHIAQAFDTLGRHDAVFGPATDGGFWLIGLRGLRPLSPDPFRGVRWSTEYALADTIDTLPFSRIGYAATLRDVDTAADLP